MKYICLGALSTVLAFTSASGQCRIGYINLHKLIMLIPENKEMEDSVSLLKERLNDNFQDLLNEYIGKIKEFDKQWGEMSERIPTINPEDITRIQNKILEQKYQDSLMLVSTEKTLLAPILDKAKKVLKAVQWKLLKAKK